jgi:hypothetical protein
MRSATSCVRRPRTSRNASPSYSLHAVIGSCRLIGCDLTHALLMPLMRVGINSI